MNRKRPVVPFILALMLAVFGSRLAAHPGAASDIVIEIGSQRSIDVLLTTRPEGLLLKLQALAASTSEDISAYRQVLVGNMAIGTPDRRMALSWIGVERPQAVEDQRSGKIVVRMRGAVPEGVETIAVQTHLIFGSYPLILRRPHHPDVLVWMQADEVSPPISLLQPAVESTISIVSSAILLGFSHIVPKGLDHVLFILGLFLLTPRVRALLLQVSVFTMAHTVTLAATTLGVLSPPASMIEPMIALSIVFVAVENVLRTNVSRWRLGLVFVFGLLHGMGFGGILTTMNLPRESLVTTLVSFNVGVELAQIAILVGAAAIVRLSAVEPSAYRRFVVRPASLAIAAVGLVWAIERIQ